MVKGGRRGEGKWIEKGEFTDAEADTELTEC